jgi:hypothetical protein
MMLGWFKKKEKSTDSSSNVANSNLSDAKQKLLAQMREKRAEIGEEELQKITSKLKLEEMKKQMRHDIENDEAKRNRLLDEIRGELRD